MSASKESIAAPGAAARAPADWTVGGAGIVYQKCGSCAHTWYFRRTFCPACGAADPQDLSSAGLGIVHAAALAIGDRVRCGFRPLGDRLLPYFEKG